MTFRIRLALPAVLLVLALAVTLAAGLRAQADGSTRLDDPSFEQPGGPDQFGRVFPKWEGWKYEGDCSFRVGTVARTGKTSCLLAGGNGGKIRIAKNLDLPAGRYKLTAHLRGLDIGDGLNGVSTEFMFNGQYMNTGLKGTFGWTPVTFVGELKAPANAGPSIGLFGPGMLWVDDVSIVPAGPGEALTARPVVGRAEAPIAPPTKLGTDAIACSSCGYRNPPGASCYACGDALTARAAATGPSVKPIASFDSANPFSGGTVVTEHATDGRRALRLDRGYASLDRPQDWTGYDFLQVDLHTDAPRPLPLSIEVRDAGTRDYWTRVNYETVVPPGRSTLVVPVRQLYVGEKSRPGRMLDLAHVTRFVIGIGESPAGPLFIDNLRLVRDEAPAKARFDGLRAFDLGTATSPVMDGFTPVTQATLYTPARGFGLKDARVWRSYDVLQPDPLYQDFLCVEKGGLAVDVPAGTYRVVVNIDNPSGYWGEYQRYRRRAVLAEGRPVVSESLDYPAFRRKYYRFWNVEDRPADDTFDKYQKAYYQEKTFDVAVADGQLNIDFQGENWACSVTSVVVFPVAKEAEGAAFLKFVEDRRRFYFDNAFKRVLHPPTGDPLAPTAADQAAGFVLFQRDPMLDVHGGDRPNQSELLSTSGPLRGEAFAGELEPLTLGLSPLRELGEVTVEPTDLTGPAGTIPASAIEIGWVGERLRRVTADGAVYTIAPRLIMPGRTAPVSAGLTRRFWLTVHTPEAAQPGRYAGRLRVESARGGKAEAPVEFVVRSGRLDPVDIPAGPFGSSIPIPWYDDDPAAADFNREIDLASLRKMREYGFTTCSGMPAIAYRGFKDGRPVLDFSRADARMEQAQRLGFLAVVGYGAGVSGIDAYHVDSGAMGEAGFKDYPSFVRAVYSAVQAHAAASGWLPVHYNLADEPIGDELTRSAENAEAYRRAFPQGPPYFTGASSFTGSNANDPHFRLARALGVVSWNGHDEAGVGLLRRAGGDWAFYNGGNRWTFGTYMYKASHQFGMKFRIAWHWNVVAGDPYYALDCREDDYAWCNTSPDGRLVPSVEFERLREGLDDYRRLVTLDRLASARPGTPEAVAARALVDGRMAAFRLGQRDHDALFPVSDWSAFRQKTDDLIDRLRPRP